MSKDGLRPREKVVSFATIREDDLKAMTDQLKLAHKTAEEVERAVLSRFNEAMTRDIITQLRDLQYELRNWRK